MAEYEVIYEFNGLYYNVFGSRELHDNINSSPENAAIFFGENTGNLEVLGVGGSMGVEDSSKGSQEFTWKHETITLLMAEYRKRKHLFRDPKTKKISLWRDIAAVFHALGYTSVTHDMLDNKFRNLKRTFTQIMDNQNKTGRGVIKWEFFDLFLEIFHEDKSVNLDRSLIISSTPSCSPSPTPAASTGRQTHPTTPSSSSTVKTSTVTPSTTAIPQQSSTPSTKRAHHNLSSEEDDVQQKKTKNKNARRVRLERQRRNALNLEEERVKELKNLTLAINESNKIQAERNNLLKEFFNKLG